MHKKIKSLHYMSHMLGVVELRALAAFHHVIPLTFAQAVDTVARGHLNDNPLFFDGISRGQIRLATQLFHRSGMPLMMVTGLSHERIKDVVGKVVVFLRIEVAPQTVIFHFAVDLTAERQLEVAEAIEGLGASVVHMGYTSSPQS